MRQCYTHISDYERNVISFLLKNDYSLKKIAEEIGRHPGTIIREIKRNSDKNGVYSPEKAKAKYKERRKNTGRKYKLYQNNSLLDYVIGGLQNYWSPEQISGRLKLKYPGNDLMRISHECIYQNIYAGCLSTSFIQYLRQGQKERRNKRSGKYKKRTVIENKKNIKDRPEEANLRSRLGDFEGDTIVGKNNQGYVATFVDRKSSFLLASKMQNKEAKTLNMAAGIAFGNIHNDTIHTITLDNGSEFAYFKDLEELFEAEVFFADPYCSWQRGLNENTNGLLRQFFPKKTNFKEVSEERLEKIVEIINSRPRKKLGYLTPYEVFYQRELIALET